MTIGKKTLFSVLLVFDLLASILGLTRVNFLYITTLISFGTCILLPGFLISLIVRIRKISFWENLIITIGLSIIFLELGGLLLNILLPLFGVKNPLAAQNIAIGFSIYHALLFVCAWIRTKPFAIQIPWPADLVASTSPTTDARSGQMPQAGMQRGGQPEQVVRSSSASQTRPGQISQTSFTPIPGSASMGAGFSSPTHARLSQFARPGLTPIPGSTSMGAGSSSPTHARLSQFARPNSRQILVPAQLAVGSSPISSARPGQFMKPGLIATSTKTPENLNSITPIQTQLMERVNSAHSRAFENVDTLTSIQIQLPERSNGAHTRAIENVETLTTLQAQPIQRARRSTSEKVLYTLPVFFPIFAILGAIRLNNGASNILTLILLASIALYSLLLVILRAKIGVNLYAYAIFFIALASLFTTSLRSWYITGHDIEREFYVFQITNTRHIWEMAVYPNPYNACLSITILPTILSNLLAIQDPYVYKLIFQLLFATTPVLLFFIVKNYTAPVNAFLAAFIFMSFPAFFNDMSMLNRQEIAFIFFVLMLYMLLLAELSLMMRKILFVVFAIGVVISHYSTNYVVLGLVVFVYILTLLISPPFVKKGLRALAAKTQIRLKESVSGQMFISLPLITVLFVTTFIWNNVYTNSSSHTGLVIVKVIANIFTQQDNTRSSDVAYSLFSFRKPDPKQDLEDYIQSVVDVAETKNTLKVNPDQFYPRAITNNYANYPVAQEKLAPTPLGNMLSALHIPVFDIHAQLKLLNAYSLQILVLIGLLSVLIFKGKKAFDLQYLLLCFSSVFMLVLITVLPSISVDYGALRMFQQLLFMLALPVVLGLSSMLFFVKEQRRVVFSAIIAVALFLNFTGFISHLTGNYYPQMTLDNAGVYYEAFYVHKSDVIAIRWLSKTNSTRENVEANFQHKNKLQTFGNIVALNELFPEILRTNAYVYLEVRSDRVITISKNVVIYNSPKPFLDENKDLLYSNGQNNIYR